MGWKDWDRTNRIGVVAGSVGVVVVVALLIVVVTGGFGSVAGPGPDPTPTAGSSGEPSETPTPSPEPTFSCSTAEGSECTEELAEREAEREQLYADAEAAYREYEGAYNRGLRSGGAEELPADLRSLLGPDIEPDILAAYQLYVDEGWQKYGESRLTVAVSSQSPEWPEDSLALDVCVDESSMTILKRGSQEFVRQGVRFRLQASMQLEEDQWKVWREQGYEEVETC